MKYSKKFSFWSWNACGAILLDRLLAGIAKAANLGAILRAVTLALLILLGSFHAMY